jgi:hypothetical protein
MLKKILGKSIMSEHEKRYWWAGFYWGILCSALTILALIIKESIGI